MAPICTLAQVGWLRMIRGAQDSGLAIPSTRWLPHRAPVLPLLPGLGGHNRPAPPRHATHPGAHVQPQVDGSGRKLFPWGRAAAPGGKGPSGRQPAPRRGPFPSADPSVSATPISLAFPFPSPFPKSGHTTHFAALLLHLFSDSLNLSGPC